MRCRVAAVAVLVTALALGGAKASLAASAQPSERACLLAWNAPGNGAGRERLRQGGPWSSAMLLPSLIGTVTFTLGSAPKQTSTPACVLMAATSRELYSVTGEWRQGRVDRWSFSGALPAGSQQIPSNVRMLPDGRVTKVYR